jgi:NitT/TauT family transport system substrate-binding protein
MDFLCLDREGFVEIDCSSPREGIILMRGNDLPEEIDMKTALCALIAAMLLVLRPAPGQASTPIVFGYTNVGDCVAAFVAKEEGYFAKRGLDVELRPMQNSATEATAIVVGALQAGCNAPPVLLQAIDRGVGLVAIAGGSVSSQSDKQSAIVVGPDSGIKSAADFKGKKVAVSGIGSNGYVMFNQYLIGQHVDFKQVSYFEVPFSTQYGALQRNTVDAVVSVVPFQTKILDDKVGVPLEYLEAAMPNGVPLVVFISSTDWTSKNPTLLAAIRGALAEGTKFAQTHQDKALEYVAQYTKQPLASVQETKFSTLSSTLTANQMQWWVNAMTAQGLIRSSIIPTNVIAK